MFSVLSWAAHAAGRIICVSTIAGDVATFVYCAAHVAEPAHEAVAVAGDITDVMIKFCMSAVMLRLTSA